MKNNINNNKIYLENKDIVYLIKTITNGILILYGIGAFHSDIKPNNLAIIMNEN